MDRRPLFKLQRNTGIITFTPGPQFKQEVRYQLTLKSTDAELDREAGPEEYEVEVYAIALGGQPRTSRTKVSY